MVKSQNTDIKSRVTLLIIVLLAENQKKLK